MEAGKAIYKLLKDDDAVGAICADRIFPEIAEQTADLPLVVYTIQSASPAGTKGGTSTIDEVQFEVMSFSSDYAQAMSLGQACRGALDRVGGTINGVQVQSIDFRTAGVDYDYTTDSHICVQTYEMRIQYVGTAASYSAIHVTQTYDAIQSTLAAQQKAGGSNAIQVQGTTPIRITFSVEDIQTSSNLELNETYGYVTVTGSGYYRLTASMTFTSDDNNVEPHIFFKIESRELESHGTAYIRGGANNDHATATAVQIAEVNNQERVSVWAYDDSNSQGGAYIEHAIFLIERVSS